MGLRIMLTVFVTALVAASCSSDGSSSSGETSPTTDSVAVTTTAQSERPATTSSTALETEPEPESSPARMRLDWFVAALNAAEPPTDQEIEQQFSPEFLAQVPPFQLVQGAAQMTAAMDLPITIESIESESPDGTALEAVLVSADGTARLRVSLVVGADEPHLIEGLLGVPDVEVEFPEDLTIDRLDETLLSLGANSSLGIYEVTDGECVALHEIRAADQVVLGSVFKLWVLADLADRIAAGEASWADMVEVEDRYKSSPDGEVFGLEAGTEISVEDLAMAMISISDNSATDHLIAYLGRDSIESALARIGVSDPAANTPLLSTAALFQLKFVAADPSSAAYRALDEAGRRALLEEIDDAVLPWAADPNSVDLINADGVAIDQPRDLDLEWFATPRDLCLTHVYLAKQAEQPGLEPVAEILEANPGLGLPFDRGRWPVIRFKGGSEPGVIAGAWWFEGDDGRRYVVAGGVSDPNRTVDEVEASVALASAVTLLG
ncbi:MAG: serine hydrolase [Acidimicrobiales bacterium]